MPARRAILAAQSSKSQPPDGKAILTVRTDPRLDGFVPTDARVPDGNGAAIHHEPGDLVLTRS